MRAIIGKARTAFLILKKVWSSSEMGKSTKLRIFNADVKSVLLYGSETRRMTQTTLHQIQTFVISCLRKILCIRWPEKTSNVDLRKTIRDQCPHSSIEESGVGLATPSGSQAATSASRLRSEIHKRRQREEDPGHYSCFLPQRTTASLLEATGADHLHLLPDTCCWTE